ncbi:MAG TPA: hypothetical protein VE198_19855 [Actinoallomurus sp.]|nr:hypothetical protein [Actinoallomurus sp.]
MRRVALEEAFWFNGLATPSSFGELRWHVLEGRPELSGATFAWAAATGGHALRLKITTTGVYSHATLTPRYGRWASTT